MAESLVESLELAPSSCYSRLLLRSGPGTTAVLIEQAVSGCRASHSAVVRHWLQVGWALAV